MNETPVGPHNLSLGCGIKDCPGRFTNTWAPMDSLGFLVQTLFRGVLRRRLRISIYNQQLLLDTLMQLVQDLMSGKDGGLYEICIPMSFAIPPLFPSPDRESRDSLKHYLPFLEIFDATQVSICRSLVSYYTILKF